MMHLLSTALKEISAFVSLWQDGAVEADDRWSAQLLEPTLEICNLATFFT